MIPPTSIDGTDITGATIDGTDVTEITVDGQTVFSAGPPPNSATNRWKFDEGTGNTVVDSIGSDDGTVNGPTWVSGTWQGGSALNADGINDNVTTPAVPPTGNAARTISITVELDNTSTFMMLWIYGADSTGKIFGLRSVSGNLQLFINGAFAQFGTVSANTIYRISVGIPSGATNEQDAVCYVNGAERSITNSVNNIGATINTGSNPITFFNNDFRDENYLDGILDDPIIHNYLLNASEMQQDYDAQPWS